MLLQKVIVVLTCKVCLLLVGMDRMIKLSDRRQLPYTEAVIFETLRMFPVAPVGLPHTTSCDTTLRKSYYSIYDLLI